MPKPKTAKPTVAKKTFFSPINLLIIIGIFVLAGLVSFFAATSGDNQANVNREKCAVDHCVYLSGETSDQQQAIVVEKGQTVQFSVADGKKHSLSQGQGGSEHNHGGSFSSGDFGDGEAWEVKFKENGSYVFHDHYNPEINIGVAVYEPGKDYQIKP